MNKRVRNFVRHEDTGCFAFGVFLLCASAIGCGGAQPPLSSEAFIPATAEPTFLDCSDFALRLQTNVAAEFLASAHAAEWLSYYLPTVRLSQIEYFDISWCDGHWLLVLRMEGDAAPVAEHFVDHAVAVESQSHTPIRAVALFAHREREHERVAIQQLSSHHLALVFQREAHTETLLTPLAFRAVEFGDCDACVLQGAYEVRTPRAAREQDNTSPSLHDVLRWTSRADFRWRRTMDSLAFEADFAGDFPDTIEENLRVAWRDLRQDPLFSALGFRDVELWVQHADSTPSPLYRLRLTSRSEDVVLGLRALFE